MSMNSGQLAEQCAEVASLARQARAWLEDPENADLVDLRKASLSQALRRSARRADRLARAASTNLSVSVFGPSQAGKSFLVSVLARPVEGRLVADYNGPGGKLDYIREINPEGEGESTGLVTRFTMTKAATPDGFPIALNLLSESDVARTIINSFFMDGDQSEPGIEPAELTRHIDQFRARMGSAEVPGLGLEDVLEIAEYLESTPAISRTAYADKLKSFKEEACLIAPRLSIADRAAFLSIYWGGHQPFTDLYIQLAEALAKIDHATEVHAKLDALIPRESSIIDVKTLHGLFETGTSDMLALRIPAGKVVDLPRAIVCALAAELVFPMESEPSPLFAKTDLLDFPGARNRFEKPLSVTLADPEKSVTQLLLRGKVAYLFDRYVENQEITSMLLCVPDSNMETLDLPGLVDNWIAMTHGSKPAQRALTDCILFFVMTKFDKHLGESAAGGGISTRFDRRMDASLIQPFGQGLDRWVDEWTPGRPFSNCYWLRNPNFFVEGLLQYDGEREQAIRPEKEERLAELREGCLAADGVKRHFRNPAEAWDAAMALNDGGVGYLTQQLAAVCTPEGKVRQIGTQMAKVAQDLQRDLGGFHVSSDIEARIAEKRLAAADIIDGLEFTLQNHRFGAFLHALCVDQDVLQDLISRVPSSIRISSAVSSAASEHMNGASPSIGAGGPARPVRPARPGRPERPAGAATTDPVASAATEEDTSAGGRGGVRTMTPEHFQSETAISAWIEVLDSFRENENTLQVLGLTPQLAADLTSEMIHAVRRLDLSSQMRAQLKTIGYGLTVDKQAPSASIVCSERINGFVQTLGADLTPEAHRPRITLADGSDRPIFATRRHADRTDTLPQDPRPVAEEIWTDWVYALEELVVANAKDGDNGTVNIEQNQRLGGILQGLSNAAEATS